MRAAPSFCVLIVVALAVTASLPCLTEGKVVEGEVKLTSDICEVFLTKFSFSQEGKIRGEFHVASPDGTYYDRHPHNLELDIFDEKSWKTYQDMVTKGSLCNQRRRLATWTIPLQPKSAEGGKFIPGHDFKFEKQVTKMPNSHYMYVLLSDCQLEEYNAKGTPLRYEIEFLNGDSQLPADESYMYSAHLLIAVVLLGFGALYFKKLSAQAQSLGQIHMVTLLLGAAWALQLLSVLMELLHLHRYASDGKGLRFRHSFFAADFLSSVLQSFAELMISYVLMCLALGWTLSHDFSSMQSLGSGLKQKMGSLFVALGLVQLTLEIWGRRYEDDFAQFHDFEHLPGYLLMLLRCLSGAFYFVQINKLLAHEDSTDATQAFLIKQKWYGLGWFFSFPALVFLSSVLHETNRHAFVTISSLSSQVAALSLMMMMFLDEKSAYYKVSTLRFTGSIFGGADVSDAAPSSSSSISSSSSGGMGITSSIASSFGQLGSTSILPGSKKSIFSAKIAKD